MAKQYKGWYVPAIDSRKIIEHLSDVKRKKMACELAQDIPDSKCSEEQCKTCLFRESLPVDVFVLWFEQELEKLETFMGWIVPARNQYPMSVELRRVFKCLEARSTCGCISCKNCLFSHTSSISDFILWEGQNSQKEMEIKNV